ncbi:MAG: hypothetical protein WDZ75_02230 [Candidatus Paceibacterota bacterium]
MGPKFPIIFPNLQEKVESKPECLRYIIYILMGTEVIKEKMKSLIILDDYATELNKCIKEGNGYVVSKMEYYSHKPYGQVYKIFSERYNIEKKDPKFFDDLKDLCEKRNEIAHDAVIKHLGDIEKANSDIKPFVLQNSMNHIQKKLTDIFNEKAKSFNKQAELV